MIDYRSKGNAASGGGAGWGRRQARVEAGTCAATAGPGEVLPLQVLLL
eukprot:COSAG02_NODE_43628_length_373_cov_0.682482_1_plen_47_part_10